MVELPVEEADEDEEDVEDQIRKKELEKKLLPKKKFLTKQADPTYTHLMRYNTKVEVPLTYRQIRRKMLSRISKIRNARNAPPRNQ